MIQDAADDGGESLPSFLHKNQPMHNHAARSNFASTRDEMTQDFDEIVPPCQRLTLPFPRYPLMSPLREQPHSTSKIRRSNSSNLSSTISFQLEVGGDINGHNGSTILNQTGLNLFDTSTTVSTQNLSMKLDLVPTMEAELDTGDAVSSSCSAAVRQPLHLVGSIEDHLPPARSSLSMGGAPTGTIPIRQLPTPVTPRKPPHTTSAKKLTLSAFRRPEETVRLTDCDASRHLEEEYNLRAPGCKVIGHGAFSTVRSALRVADDKVVAIKSISKFDALRARRLRRPGSKHMDEWEIMKVLRNNPYVLTLFDVFETESEIHLVTEFCQGGELFAAIKRKGGRRHSFRRGRFSEAQAARITHQILKALVGLHALGIVHRDIKAENILLLNSDESDIQVKLCDFGVARYHHEEHQCSTSGASSEMSSDGESSPLTPSLGSSYSTNAPPEACRGSCGPAADVFSLGVTLYILLCGFPPVFCDDVVQFPEAYWQDVTEEAREVVRSMLHRDPNQRITASGALSIPWVGQQTTRVRRGSISANLELVRSRLAKSLGDALSSPQRAASGKRGRRGSLILSPKRARRCSLGGDISMTELFTASEKRDIRVIEKRIESRGGGDERGEVITTTSTNLKIVCP